MGELLSKQTTSFVDYFDGLARLYVLLNPTQPAKKRILTIDSVKHKPVDKTDLKFISFLQGKKVCFNEEEIDKHLIDLQSLEDKQPATGGS